MSESVFYDLKDLPGPTPSLSAEVARDLGTNIVSSKFAPGELIEDEGA